MRLADAFGHDFKDRFYKSEGGCVEVDHLKCCENIDIPLKAVIQTCDNSTFQELMKVDTVTQGTSK